MNGKQLADTKDRVPRLALKTAKKHFSFMQQLWKYLDKKPHVSGDPFAGFEFPNTKAKRGNRDEWSKADLLAVLHYNRMKQSAAEGGRDVWIISTAMYSGTRMEKSAVSGRQRISRPLVEFLFFMQDQKSPEWSTKSEAGERVAPIHPALTSTGIMMELVRLLHRVHSVCCRVSQRGDEGAGGLGRDQWAGIIGRVDRRRYGANRLAADRRNNGPGIAFERAAERAQARPLISDEPAADSSSTLLRATATPVSANATAEFGTLVTISGEPASIEEGINGVCTDSQQQ